VLFGECFDYDALKRDLVQRGHAFSQDGGDAEFCMRLYEEYGEGAFVQLDGSFCLAIADTRERQILLVSDRLATRPLFWGLGADGTFVFGTQAAVVLGRPQVDRTLDESAVVEFCCLQRVVGTKTYQAGVKLMPPASVLRFRDGRATMTPYWRLRYQPRAGSIDAYAEELAEVMRRMGRRLFRGGGRVAMLLSGGLDARMVLAAAEQPLECFTFGDYMNPEAFAAKALADAKGYRFHLLQRQPDHYPNLVDRAVAIGSGMHPFNHAHAIGFIEGIAAEYDVVTHGYAPELLFRGVNLPKTGRSVLGLDVGETLDRTLSAENVAQRIFQRGYLLLGAGVREVFSPRLRDVIDEMLLASGQSTVTEARESSANVYDQFLWPDVYYHGRYPSMLFELSLRPFMTERSMVFGNEVLDLHLRMPVEVRSDNRTWLAAMERLDRKVARAVNANTGFAPSTPQAFISLSQRAKAALQKLPFAWRAGGGSSGSAIPNGLSPISWPRFDWLIRHNEKMRRLILDAISDPETLPSTLFEGNRVSDMLHAHLEGRTSHRLILFTLLTFGWWHKHYIRHGRRQAKAGV
jgi:asparagine synthase (glutamine-hydrolysing)